MRHQKTIDYEPSSFRDPSGFVYYQNNHVFRHVDSAYKAHLESLFHSGLFDYLVKKKYLLPFTPVASAPLSNSAYATYQTPKLPFISYPYEWTFSQLKDAALLTLLIQKKALEYGLTLKDASAYNIQFVDARPIFIDLLSFEQYETGTPWVAYKQFCQHFLGPLLLMSFLDVRLGSLLRVHLDGVPLDLVSKLLPKRTYLSPAIISHIHLHARNQRAFGDVSKQSSVSQYQLNKMALLGIIDSLEGLVKKLKSAQDSTEWGEYYTFTNYSGAAFLRKKKLVEQYLDQVRPKTVWDLGANNGEFSRLASHKNIFTLSSDLDPVAVETNYLHARKTNEKNLLPLLLDLTNPSPALGWANQERRSLMARGPADGVMALALVHHLAISSNLPFAHLADFFARLGTFLIIEFVPKSDSQVRKLLATRKDIFTHYTQQDFEREFAQQFKILKKNSLPESKRTLYLMKVK